MDKNPFIAQDPDRHAIWDMLVDRDIQAFIAVDWSLVAGDFIAENFMGIDAGGMHNPDAWRLQFPELDAYKEEWLRQARAFKDVDWGEDPKKAMFRITTLKDIEISGNSALVHKKFLGSLVKKDGELTPMSWQTLYRCRKVNGSWKIAGFTGYMPYDLGTAKAGV